jgi:DNA replication protein DnaC
MSCDDKYQCRAITCDNKLIDYAECPSDCIAICKKESHCTLVKKKNFKCEHCLNSDKCDKPPVCYGQWENQNSCECEKNYSNCMFYGDCVKYNRSLKANTLLDSRKERKEKLLKAIDCYAGSRYLCAKISDFNLSMTYPIYKSIKNKMNAFIYGTAGTGKTHLTVGFYRLFYKIPYMSAPRAGFVKSNSLLIEIKDTFRNNSEESEIGIIEKYSKYSVLFIDDVGSEKVTEWVLSVWYEIIDARYSREKPTIFTSNLTPEQIFSVYGERLASRILSGIMFEIKGKDRRLQ